MATATTPNRNIYIMDAYGECWILRYDRDSKYIGHFGSLCSAEPAHVDVPSPKPQLDIAGCGNSGILLFILDG